MVGVSIARRWARALLAAALEEGQADAVLEELETLTARLEGSPELRAVFESPSFGRPQRLGVVEALVQAGGFSRLTSNFLRLLVDRDRLGHLEMMVRLYRDLADEAAGRIRARVVTPATLPDDQASRLVNALEATTSKHVRLQRDQDPALLGGLLAQVGDLVFDGSLRTQLRSLRESLLGSRHA